MNITGANGSSGNGGDGKKRISVLTTEDEERRSSMAHAHSPRIAVLESEKEFLVKAEIPGVSPDDINVKIENGRLTLEARRKPTEHERAAAVVRGRDLDDYRRAFTVGRGIDSTNMRAVMGNDGILAVHLPKKQERDARAIAIAES